MKFSRLYLKPCQIASERVDSPPVGTGAVSAENSAADQLSKNRTRNAFPVLPSSTYPALKVMSFVLNASSEKHGELRPNGMVDAQHYEKRCAE